MKGGYCSASVRGAGPRVGHSVPTVGLRIAARSRPVCRGTQYPLVAAEAIRFGMPSSVTWCGAGVRSSGTATAPLAGTAWRRWCLGAGSRWHHSVGRVYGGSEVRGGGTCAVSSSHTVERRYVCGE